MTSSDHMVESQSVRMVKYPHNRRISQRWTLLKCLDQSHLRWKRSEAKILTSFHQEMRGAASIGCTPEPWPTAKQGSHKSSFKILSGILFGPRDTILKPVPSALLNAGNIAQLRKQTVVRFHRLRRNFNELHMIALSLPRFSPATRSAMMLSNVSVKKPSFLLKKTLTLSVCPDMWMHVENFRYCRYSAKSEKQDI